jgi:hypothetical protein
MVHALLRMCLILLCCSAAASAAASVTVDADFPAGNIIVEGVDGDTVRLRPDLRDTEGNWFYWAFRVREAQGRTLSFIFTRQAPVGARGAAVSLDEGLTWTWLGRANATNDRFTYTFGTDARSVRFSFGMPYTAEHLERFLNGIGPHQSLRIDRLATTRKGRPVERLHIGNLAGEPRFRVLVTARHHACEMMGSYSLEGMIQAMLADDEPGRWFREHVEVLAIPFVDKDGVEDGDQGKNRRPRDHNRDYSDRSIHVETAALRELVPAWSGGRLVAMLDLHCPYIRGGRNERIFQPGKSDPALWEQQQKFAAHLKRHLAGPLPYDPADDLPFGREWNTAGNTAQGTSSTTWAGALPGVKLASTIEIPYASAGGKAVDQESARAFGRDLAAALRAYLAELP